jgi:hypothetical protein
MAVAVALFFVAPAHALCAVDALVLAREVTFPLDAEVGVHDRDAVRAEHVGSLAPQFELTNGRADDTADYGSEGRVGSRRLGEPQLCVRFPAADTAATTFAAECCAGYVVHGREVLVQVLELATYYAPARLTQEHGAYADGAVGIPQEVEGHAAAGEVVGDTYCSTAELFTENNVVVATCAEADEVLSSLLIELVAPYAQVFFLGALDEPSRQSGVVGELIEVVPFKLAILVEQHVAALARGWIVGTQY